MSKANCFGSEGASLAILRQVVGGMTNANGCEPVEGAAKRNLLVVVAACREMPSGTRELRDSGRVLFDSEHY